MSTELTPEHRQYLNDHAVTDRVIEATGIWSANGEIIFPWTDGDQRTEQRRPWPGDSGQYYWEEKDLHFWNLRDAGPESPVLLVEGTKQSLAATGYAPAEYSVMGMPGCDGWSKCDLSRFADRTVFLALDADAGTNLSVYEAGDLFREEAEFWNTTVRYLWLPARGKAGLDDVLAKKPDTHRERFVEYLIGKAQAKPAERKPQTRKGARMETILPETGDRIGVAINVDRKDVIDKIVGAMKDKLDGVSLFNYGEVLTRVQGHETQPMLRDAFHAQLVDVVSCFHYTEATDKRPAVFVPQWPDSQTVGAVMSKASEFSPLKRVVRVPFLRPDGTVCTTDGYDTDTATVLVTNGLAVETPSTPSQQDVQAAASFLMDEWLGDFPLQTQADRANTLALLLTPFIRGLVPLVPLAVVNGLEAGVGKNLMADCIAILATGEAAMPLPWVANDEEMRKQITASFMSGAEMFVFDEAHSIEGAQVARALTSLTYGDRILGASTMCKFPNQATWVSLGNQVHVNGDMSRRVYFISMSPVGTTLSDRDQREYRHPEILAWTLENRAQLVSAALTVLSGWFSAGKPAYSRGASLGSFEPWDRMMSSVTAYAGYPHFLTDVKDRRSESDFDHAYWEAHVAWLASVFGDAEFTTRQVQEAALRDRPGYEAPPKMDDPSGEAYPRTLGMAYSKKKDRVLGKNILVKSGIGHRSVNKWCVKTQKTEGVEGVEGVSMSAFVEGDPSVAHDGARVAIRVSERGDSLQVPPSLRPVQVPGVNPFEK